MTAQIFKPHRKLGSLSAGAFAALLVLSTAAPQASAEVSKQHDNDSSEATSGSSGSSSSSRGSSGSSGGGYASASNGDRGGRSGGGDRGGRGGGGRGGDRGGRGGDHGGRGGGWHSDGRGDRSGGYHRGDRGRGRGWGHGGGYYGGGYRSGRYYGWGGYYGGWGGWWPWWYPTYGGTTVIMEPRYRYGGGGTGALDLDVSPEKAQIFVDGEYVGRADDYDGFPTFLWLDSGTYDVGIYHEGYETIVRQYTIRPGALIDVEDQMRPGNAILPEELMTPKSTEVRDTRIQRNAEQEAAVDRAEAESDYDDQDGRSSDQQVGRLLLSLWPPDAAIYLDGNFLGTAEEIGQLSAGLVVEPGEHQLEVVRPGYGTIRRSVSVPAGEKTEVKFELNKN